MRTPLHFVAALAAALLAGCAGDAPPPAAGVATATRTDPAAASRVEAWPLPANLPGSALPDLVLAPDGRLLLSWVNSQRGRRHILQFSAHAPGAGGWQSAPMTVAIGNSMLVNWADTPHIAATADGALWVHWLQLRGDGSQAHDIMLATSRNGGARWSTPLVPYDRVSSQHGFVSLWPQRADAVGIAWLEGGDPALARHPGHAAASAADPVVADGHAGHGGARTTLRSNVADAALRTGDAATVDASACDCCQTDVAVTARGPLLVYRGRTDDEVRDILATRLGEGGWSTPAPVHGDGWATPACPVNGPAVAASGDEVLVGWYTAPGDAPQVRLARSADGGDSFAAPVVLDEGATVLGRVDVAVGDGEAWALWLREDAQGQSLWLSRRSADLATEHERLQLARLAGRGHATGFPKLALRDGVAHVVWTDVVDGAAQLRGVRVLP